MSYQGAEALRLAGVQTQMGHPQRVPAPSFEVIEGDGLDARARQSVDTVFIARMRACICVVLFVALIGCLRVALSAATVTALEEGSTLRQQVSELEDLNAQLEVERSVDSSTQRIVAIATQAYGMVYATDVDTITLPASIGH